MTASATQSETRPAPSSRPTTRGARSLPIAVNGISTAVGLRLARSPGPARARRPRSRSGPAPASSNTCTRPRRTRPAPGRAPRSAPDPIDDDARRGRPRPASRRASQTASSDGRRSLPSRCSANVMMARHPRSPSLLRGAAAAAPSPGVARSPSIIRTAGRAGGSSRAATRRPRSERGRVEAERGRVLRLERLLLGGHDALEARVARLVRGPSGPRSPPAATSPRSRARPRPRAPRVALPSPDLDLHRHRHLRQVEQLRQQARDLAVVAAHALLAGQDQVERASALMAAARTRAVPSVSQPVERAGP